MSCIRYNRGIFSPSEGKEEKNMARRYKENADYLSTMYPESAKIYMNFIIYTRMRQRKSVKRQRTECIKMLLCNEL